MYNIKKVTTSTLLLLVILSICFGGFGFAQKNNNHQVVPDCPILVGPSGTRFWTTYSNAIKLFDKPIIFCKTVHCDHQIGTAQDSYKNRYMSAEKPGDTVDLQLVAKADDRYETAGGMQVLFHKYPIEGAPWVGKTHFDYYFKDANGTITKIGQISKSYHTINGVQRLMTKGMSKGEKWTGDSNGKIYHMTSKEKMIIVGEFDRRWATPIDKKRLMLPLMMSRANKKSPWVGELGGIIYVEDHRK